MSARHLLIVTMTAEAPLGIMLMLSPSMISGLLPGVPIDGPAAEIVGRVAGAALLALGVACWLSRDDGSSRAGRALIAALLVYNCATIAILVHAATVTGLTGLLLWPAVALHLALAAWCFSRAKSLLS